MVCRSVGAAPRRAPRVRDLVPAVLALCGFSACEPAQEVSTWPLALRQVGSCKVGEPSELELVALGDFPSRSYRWRADERAPSVDDVPLQLRELLVRATTPLGIAQGRRLNASHPGMTRVEPDAVWMLQSGTSCPLAHTALSAIDGRALAALPDGGALLVGGIENGAVAKSEALLLAEGQEFAVEVVGGMLLRRAYASATALNDLVLIAGGTPDRRAGAHDTFELLDLAAARFVAARSGKLQEARMQHAAVRLPDDKVLLIGGRTEPEGEPLTSLELVDARVGTSERLAGTLQVPRVAPSALTLDSGSVLVLGGRDGAGRLLGSVEMYDPAAADFALAGSELPVHAQACVAAMPGARAAWLSCDHAQAGGGAPCELVLIRELAGELQITPVALDFESEVANGLTELRLVYAGDGQLLWTGADDSDPTGRRRAFSIDVVTQSLRRIEASRVPAALLRLDNGLIAELDAAGASLRAALTRGRYASPEGDLLADAAANLVLDVPGHWSWQDDGLSALSDDARMDLAELRFAAFQARVRVQGDYALQLYDGLGERAELSVRGSMLELPGCRYQLQGDSDLQLVRAGSRLTVSGTTCSMEVTVSALGIGLVLAKGAVVRGVTIQRM
jgi:hypothetical protein